MLHIVNLNLLEWVFLCFYTHINKFSKNKVKGEFGKINCISFVQMIVTVHIEKSYISDLRICTQESDKTSNSN